MGLFRTATSGRGARPDPFLGEDFSPLFREAPLVVYDVGAAGELYHPYRGPLPEHVRIFGFEPVEESFRALARRYEGEPRVEVRRVALCDRDGTVPFHLSTSGRVTYSSLVDLSARGLPSEAVEVEGTRLDSVPARYGFPPADFLKLDTEGSELVALASGRAMLEKEVLGALVEISFWRKGTEGALFHEIDRFMNERGFVLYDLRINRSHISGVGGKKDKVRSGDALYLRDFSEYWARNGGDRAPEELRAKMVKLVSLCLAWGYLEYAIELLAFGRSQGLASEEEFRRLTREWSSVVDIASRIPDFPGRTRLARLLDALSYALHGKAKKGIPEPFDGLGNPWRLTARGRPRARVRIKDPVLQEDGNAGIKTVDLNGSPP